MGIASEFTTYGMSPDEDDTNASLFDELEGDDGAEEVEGAEGADDLGSSMNPAPKRKSSSAASRKGPQGADKRATHNAIERARRETLNGRFMTLAEALPSMAKVKRPSKSVIVNKALDFVFEAQVKEHTLIKENNELRREVDNLRRQLGLPPLPPPAALSSKEESTAARAKAALVRQASSASASSALDLAHSMSHLDTNAVSPTQTSSFGESNVSPSTTSFDSPPTMKLENSATAQSPNLTFPSSMPIATSMFANAGSPTGSLSDNSEPFSQSLSSSAPQGVPLSASPFALHHHHHHSITGLGNPMHPQAIMPAQLGYYPPGMLQASQQQQMLFAAMQQQQQQQAQLHHQQQSSPHNSTFDQYYAMNPALLGAAWSGGFPHV